MKVVTEYTNCPYITAGKEYEVVKGEPDYLFTIVDDEGDIIASSTNFPDNQGCCHLDDIGHWEEVVE